MTDQLSLVDAADMLEEDRRIVQAIELAVVGLGHDHDCAEESASIRGLLRHVDERLSERSRQLNAVIGHVRERGGL